MKFKKVVLSGVCAAALVVGTVAGTMAYLTDKTETVTNTFTVGNVDITLTESTGTDYKVSPGVDITKDPTVTVKANSDECYVFVKVDNKLMAGCTFALTENWTLVDSGKQIYRYNTTIPASAADNYLQVLKDNKIDVADDVAASSNGTLSFKACAVQADGMTVDSAFAEAVGLLA